MIHVFVAVAVAVALGIWMMFALAGCIAEYGENRGIVSRKNVCDSDKVDDSERRI